MAWNVDEADGRQLLDDLDESNGDRTLTERLPQQFSPHVTDAAFMEAGCEIARRLNEVCDLPQGMDLRRIFSQQSHHAPRGRPHSYIFPLEAVGRHSKADVPGGHVRLTQQGTGYFHPRNSVEFDAANPFGAEGVIATTMNAKDGHHGHIIVGRMLVPEHTEPRSQQCWCSVRY